MEYLGAWGTLIHEKNLKSKISCQTPFKGSWKWSDGTALDYTNWKVGFPVNSTAANCIITDAAAGNEELWANVGCFFDVRYVCKL